MLRDTKIAELSTLLLLQEPKNLEPTSRSSRQAAFTESETHEPRIGSHIPDRWPYFLGKLSEEEPWEAMTIGALVKIAQATSLQAVTTALEHASESPPVLRGSAYGWLLATSRELNR